MRVVRYLRTSSDRQRERQTIQSQRFALDRLAVERDIRLLADYVDDGISGTLIDERESFKHLLDDAASGKFNAVLCTELSRLTRPQELDDLAAVKRVFRDNNVLVMTPERTYDFSNDADDFLTDILGVVAKKERKDIAARCARGRKRAVSEGRNPGMQAPFGYFWDRNLRCFVVVEEEAVIVRELFSRALHESTRALLQWLRQVGVLSRRGGWCKSSVRRLLSNPMYKGELVYNRVRVIKRGGRQWKHVGRPVQDRIVGQVPAVVPAELWEAVQTAVTHRESPRNRKRPYLLAHLLRCAECGVRWSGDVARGVRYYRFRQQDHTQRRRHEGPTWLRADELEEKVWEVVRRVIEEPQLLLVAMEAAQPTQTDDPATEIARLRDLLDRNRAQIDRANRLLVKEQIREDEHERLLSSLRAEEELLRRNLAVIEERSRVLASRKQHVEDFVRLVHAASEREWTFERQHRVLELLCGAKGTGIFVDHDGRVELRGFLCAGRVTEGQPVRMTA